MPRKPKPKPVADPATRFAADLAALTSDTIVGSARFGVAVSGGPDSMALLWLAHRMLGARCFAATVDHGLRPEAADEAEMVAQWCAVHGVEHQVLTPDAPIKGSLQAAAREVRYALLHQWMVGHAIDWLMTAHHADDQLETMLMRLNRSSGVGGLAGIRARNGAILRPVLRWSRDELQTICDENALPFCRDPSNDDDMFDRVQVRQALRETPWLDAAAAAASAGALNAADQALDWAARRCIAQWSDPADLTMIESGDYPDEIQRRILKLRLAALDPDLSVRGEAMGRLLAAMQRGEKAMIGDWQIVPVPNAQRPLWHIIRAARRKAR